MKNIFKALLLLMLSVFIACSVSPEKATKSVKEKIREIVEEAQEVIEPAEPDTAGP